MWFFGGLLVVVIGAGCASKSDKQARQRAALMAAQQQQAAAMQQQQQQVNSSAVWVVGNVRNPSIPWTQDLTLRRALIEADYQGPGDPNQIVVLRNGSQPTTINAKDLLGGFDMPLQACDRVEVR